MNYRYYRSLTGTTCGAWSEVPVGVYSEFDFQISNRFVFRSVFDVGNLENKPWRGFLLG
jgi:hypothetical protein